MISVYPQVVSCQTLLTFASSKGQFLKTNFVLITLVKSQDFKASMVHLPEKYNHAKLKSLAVFNATIME